MGTAVGVGVGVGDGVFVGVDVEVGDGVLVGVGVAVFGRTSVDAAMDTSCSFDDSGSVVGSPSYLHPAASSPKNSRSNKNRSRLKNLHQLMWIIGKLSVNFPPGLP